MSDRILNCFCGLITIAVGLLVFAAFPSQKWPECKEWDAALSRCYFVDPLLDEDLIRHSKTCEYCKKRLARCCE